MFEELGISFGTAIVILIALYFIVKWAVRNAVKEAYEEIRARLCATRMMILMMTKRKTTI